MQLVVSGCDAVVGPVAVALSLCSIREIGAARSELAALQNILSWSNHLPRAPPHWTARTKRLRDALIALDWRRAGASVRQIAVVIYGRERVKREWPDKGLKQQLRRDFQRGEALCNGGYRGLLRRAGVNFRIL